MKPNHVVAADRMLDGGFGAKASSLKPRSSVLYLEAQMNGRNVSWIDKEATHAFISSKPIGGWDLPAGRAGKPTKVQFAKGEPHEANETAMHVIF